MARLGLLLAVVCGLPARGLAQGPDNVLVVVNELSEASVRIGTYYALKRNVPDRHVVRLKAPVSESVSRAEYAATIEGPIANWLARHQLQDQVLYIVLTKDVPLRVAGTAGLDGSAASVDSELTLLYRRLLGLDVRTLGRVDNPYYLDQRPLSQARPFTRMGSDIYLVTRLDGFIEADVFALIDRALSPTREGRVVLDQRMPLDPDGGGAGAGGDQWLRLAADRLTSIAAGDRVVLDDTPVAAATPSPVIAYASWGSNDVALRDRRSGLTFARGAIGALFVSADGRTFAEPPEGWVPGSPRGRSAPFAGSDQTLAADLIRDGITGLSAHVTEPYLDAMIRPQVLFPAYLSGLNLAEAFYAAMPYLSWQTVVLGDPLCAPFRTHALGAADLAKPVDAATELPEIFASRRLAELGRTGHNQAALVLRLKADSRVFRGASERDVEPLLVEAATLEPRLTDVQLRLGMLAQGRDETAVAIGRYRQVLKIEPSQVVALNNLAFALSADAASLDEALALAERAFRLVPNATIADTLGWVHHRRGNHATAAPLIERALAADGRNVDFLLHAASVHAALNDLPRARTELETALKINPAIASRADVKALQDRLRD